MADEQIKQTNFWMALLEFGETEEERRQHWNTYCNWQYGKHLDRFVTRDVEKEIRQKLNFTSRDGDEERALDELADKFGGHPGLPEDPSYIFESLMNFREEKFPNDISFAGRLLIGADFREAVFGQRADFRGAVFVGSTHFKGAQFERTKPASPGVASFNGSCFYNTVDFSNVRFPHSTKFEDVTFHGDAEFCAAEFAPKLGTADSPYGVVNFGKARFRGEADFTDAVFGVGVKFEKTTLENTATFHMAKFLNLTSFNNAEFKSTTSFRRAVFDQPPRFFETNLHEDTDFELIDWKGAEQSYNHPWWRGKPPESITHIADDAVRAWDRLALIMSQQERPFERHEFFRLKMRARRYSDGSCLTSWLDCLYETFADYGWGVRKALFWWVGHMVFWAAILGGGALVCPSYPALGSFLICWNSLLVSFANSLGFLRLGSEGGYLHSAHVDLMNASQADWVFNAVGAIQAVLGPVLLFMVLLTVRNRFRLG